MDCPYSLGKPVMNKVRKNHSVALFRGLAIIVGAALVGVFVAPFYGGLERGGPMVETTTLPDADGANAAENIAPQNNIAVEQFDYTEPEFDTSSQTPTAPNAAEGVENDTEKKDTEQDGALISDEEGSKSSSDPAEAASTQTSNSDDPVRLIPRPVAIAAGKLESRGRTIMLEGIDPLSIDETCQSSMGETWPCGMHARTAFRQWLRARAIMCRVPDDDAIDRVTTQCTVANQDPALWLVEMGWARPIPGGPYEEAGQKASKEKRGIYGEKPQTIVPEFNADLQPQSGLEGQPDQLDSNPALNQQPLPHLEGEFPPAPLDERT